MNPNENSSYESLSRVDKLKKLFEQQKHVLDCFLERGAWAEGKDEDAIALVLPCFINISVL